MKSLSYRMNKARMAVMGAINMTMKELDLPAYIMESIVADALGDLRFTSKLEVMNEMEREVNEEKKAKDEEQKKGK